IARAIGGRGQRVLLDGGVEVIDGLFDEPLPTFLALARTSRGRGFELDPFFTRGTGFGRFFHPAPERQCRHALVVVTALIRAGDWPLAGPARFGSRTTLVFFASRHKQEC